VAFGLTWLLREVPLRGRPHPPTAEEPAAELAPA
jgi:hypothetical protein